MAYLVSNGGISTLASGIATITQTSIVLSSGHGVRYPSPTSGDYTLVTLENAAGAIEIVSIVGRSTDTLTVGVAGSAAADAAGRGQEGTTAAIWLTGDIIEGRATAAIVSRGGNAKTTAELVATSGSALVGSPAGSNLAGVTVAAQLVELGTGLNINTATAKATPVDADKFGYWDSVSMVMRSATWANIKTVLKAYFDPIYAAIAQVHYVGTTSIAANRGSGAQTLTGVNIDGSAASATNATNATNLSGGTVAATSITRASATGTGVTSTSTTGVGVYGLSSSSNGVRGDSGSGAGVYAQSSSGAGLSALSTTGPALYLVASTQPTTWLVAGSVYYSSSTNKLRVYNGSSWETITSA